MFFKKRHKKSTPEQEAEFQQMLEDNNVGFKDKFAMMLSAFLVIFLPTALILCLFGGFIMLLFSLLS